MSSETANPGVNDADAPCRCHQHLGKMLSHHSGHCCFRSPAATCHAAEVAAWEARYEAEKGRSPRDVRPHEMYGNFVG